MSKSDVRAIVEAVKKARRVLIATHVFPDGDALGSQIGLGNILEGLGKEVVLYGEEEVSYLYDFLPCCERLVTEIPDPETIDCAFALDCGDRLRLGEKVDELLAIRPFLVVDHHAGHKNFGDLRWVDQHRASTGEMVYELAEALGADLSYDAAFCLFAAIVSDTGSFKYASVTEETFRVAAKLIAKGVNPEVVSGKLFDNFTEQRLHLLQSVLSTLELYGGGKAAVITATSKMFEITGTEPRDTETFINYPRSLASVKVAVFLKETDDVISVSMRSKGSRYDVAEVARKFGGGGHRNAAGCKFRNGETLGEVRELLFEEIIPLVEKG